MTTRADRLAAWALRQELAKEGFDVDEQMEAAIFGTPEAAEHAEWHERIFAHGLQQGRAESAATIARLRGALEQCDRWIDEWTYRDEKRRFFAQPNEVRVCREFIRAALAAEAAPR